MGPLAYLVYWVQQTPASIFGILGHLTMLNHGPMMWPFVVLSILTGYSILIRWRPWDASWLPSCLMMISACYGLFLIYGVNYKIYLSFASPVLALQGRYIFPVLGPVYVLSSYYLLRLFRSDYVRLGVAIAVSILFIASDFPFFLLHVTPDWFAPFTIDPVRNDTRNQPDERTLTDANTNALSNVTKVV
jgi:hypothetical protein